MLRRLFNRKGQNTAEYAIVIGLIIAAAIAMQTYVKRGLQGRVKNAVDHKVGGEVAGEALDFNTAQYEPYYADSGFHSTSDREEVKGMATGGSTSTILTKEETIRVGTQKTLNFESPDIAN